MQCICMCSMLQSILYSVPYFEEQCCSAVAHCRLLCAAKAGIGDDLTCCRKDLVEEMTKPIWWIDRKGEIAAGQKEAYQQPIFQYHDVSWQFFAI